MPAIHNPRDRHSEDTTDSIFDIVDKTGSHHNEEEEEEEEEGIDVNEDDEDDEFMFFDELKADSYSITETNIQIFKKYSHDRKSQQLQKTTTTNGNAEVNTIIDNFLNDYEQDLDVEEEEEEEEGEMVDQAGLDNNEEIKKLEMLLIQEKQNYLIKQQQREIRHLQELLNAQNDLNKKLMRQLHRDDQKVQKKLLPPFTVMRRRNSENEDQEDNVSIVSNDSFIMSEHLISSRSTSLEQVHV
ncbi:hypothetical protein Cantr_05882 [Candida viswanathii]|uniref:Uncharacterized protein n=1 Tax=Candida viswanathii TaxID=5486 RepID=A0A367XQE7_9ASCO|nr:hypothetical protein Cantr_05882 [Candida viswanathii]